MPVLRKIAPSLQKKKTPKNLSVISDPQISDYFLWLSWLQSIIQNFFCLLVSSEERSLLKQRQRLLPMGKRGTWAFTLCNTLEFCRVIKKKTEVLSWMETSLFQLGVEGKSCSLTGLAVPPFRAVLAGRDQAPAERHTAVGEVIESHTMPTLRYSSLFHIIPSSLD